MKTLHHTEVIRRPVTSEKTTFLGQRRNTYTFEVHSKCDKQEIKDAVEKLYSVHVTHVRTVRVPGKPKRSRSGYRTTPEWKKALVTVAENERIDIY